MKENESSPDIEKSSEGFNNKINSKVSTGAVLSYGKEIFSAVIIGVLVTVISTVILTGYLNDDEDQGNEKPESENTKNTNILSENFNKSSLEFRNSKKFSNWMLGDDLNGYFDELNKFDKKLNFFDKGHRINAVEGRFNSGKVEYRVAIGDTPKNIAHSWWWWINQSHESFLEKNIQYKKIGARLVYSQSFPMPDGTVQFQGVWQKVGQ